MAQARHPTEEGVSDTVSPRHTMRTGPVGLCRFNIYSQSGETYIFSLQFDNGRFRRPCYTDPHTHKLELTTHQQHEGVHVLH